MSAPIDKRGEGQRNLRELFQDYADKYVCEERDTGAPVGEEVFDQFYGETNQRRPTSIVGVGLLFSVSLFYL